jgi:hypothetical protein
MEEAGSALVSRIADHWKVCENVARDIIGEGRLIPTKDSGWKRYLWQDIWRLEGEVFVAKRFWSDYRKPLLKPSELHHEDPEKRSDRTFRRYVEQGKIPSIDLSPTVRRVRRCTFDIVIHHV